MEDVDSDDTLYDDLCRQFDDNGVLPSSSQFREYASVPRKQRAVLRFLCDKVALPHADLATSYEEAAKAEGLTVCVPEDADFGSVISGDADAVTEIVALLRTVHIGYLDSGNPLERVRLTRLGFDAHLKRRLKLSFEQGGDWISLIRELLHSHNGRSGLFRLRGVIEFLLGVCEELSQKNGLVTPDLTFPSLPEVAPLKMPLSREDRQKGQASRGLGRGKKTRRRRRRQRWAREGSPKPQIDDDADDLLPESLRASSKKRQARKRENPSFTKKHLRDEIELLKGQLNRAKQKAVQLNETVFSLEHFRTECDQMSKKVELLTRQKKSLQKRNKALERRMQIFEDVTSSQSSSSQSSSGRVSRSGTADLRMTLDALAQSKKENETLTMRFEKQDRVLEEQGAMLMLLKEQVEEDRVWKKRMEERQKRTEGEVRRLTRENSQLKKLERSRDRKRQLFLNSGIISRYLALARRLGATGKSLAQLLLSIESSDSEELHRLAFWDPVTGVSAAAVASEMGAILGKRNRLAHGLFVYSDSDEELVPLRGFQWVDHHDHVGGVGGGGAEQGAEAMMESERDAAVVVPGLVMSPCLEGLLSVCPGYDESACVEEYLPSVPPKTGGGEEEEEE